MPRSCNHTAGNQFFDRGVQPEDTVFVISFSNGRLRVLGRLVVGEIVDRPTARQRLPYEPWDGRDQVLAQKGTATTLTFDRWLSDRDIELLEFVTADGNIDGFKRKRDGSIEPQSFRGVREITTKSAAILDRYVQSKP